ncbi:MAG: transcriptional repressor LexA [Dehalococcoidia bacterium]|jgi:repressor LexA|nr:transcriptional repressor LexA [Dehalococcoidia bacterium]
MAEPISAKQQSILDFMREFIDEKDYPPSIRDIQRGCDISSTSVVDYNLKRLEEKGFIRRDREVSRAIELLEAGGRRARTVRVPVLGKIAAGLPIPTPPETLTPDQYDDFVEVTDGQTRGKANVFALRVEGESMVDALINDGDIVLLEPVNSFDDGEMVAVWLKDQDETTLKKLYREGERVRLQPMNAQMDAFYTAAENVEVHGRVLGAIRQW